MFLPVISTGSVTTTDRSSATLYLTSNTLAFIYFMIADTRVPVPAFADVKSQTNTELMSYSNPIFGVNYVKTGAFDVTIKVTGLQPQHDYDFYAYIVNLNQVSNPVYLKLSFSTNRIFEGNS